MFEWQWPLRRKSLTEKTLEKQSADYGQKQSYPPMPRPIPPPPSPPPKRVIGYKEPAPENYVAPSLRDLVPAKDAPFTYVFPRKLASERIHDVVADTLATLHKLAEREPTVKEFVSAHLKAMEPANDVDRESHSPPTSEKLIVPRFVLNPESLKSTADAAIGKLWKKNPVPAAKEQNMLFAILLGYGLSLLPAIVVGVQKVAADAKAGDTVEQMAHDALAEALAGAAAIFPNGSADATLAAGAGTVASEVIDVVGSVVDHIKATGAVKTTMQFVEHAAAFRKL